MDTSFLDLLGSSKKLDSKHEAEEAPIELVTQFLACVQDGEISQALDICIQILKFEPGNRMMIEYKRALSSYVEQCQAESDDSEESEEEDEVEVDDDEDEEEDDPTENDEDLNSA